MTTLKILTARNIKLFFKDKGMFFTSLVTPVILLVLYATFLGNIYKNTFLSAVPQGITLPDGVINACVAGQLVSSLLAVSCVTVAFCSNFLMVADRANETVKDLTVSPVKPYVLALAYYFASLLATFIVCFGATALCLVYTAFVGWYMSFADVLLLLADVVLVVMFGTALSSVIHFFLSSQGQLSAVGAIVSAGYGFICGAYLPISQFSEGLRNFIAFLPGTYGTSLIRNHAMNGVYAEMSSLGMPEQAMDALRDAIDCNIYFFGQKVEPAVMYLTVVGAVILLVGIYILQNFLRNRKSGAR